MPTVDASGPVPAHVTAAADELEALARELLPRVLDLADRYDQASWSSELYGFDLDDAGHGQHIYDLCCVAGAIICAMRLRLDEVQPDTWIPAALVEVVPEAAERLPQYERLVRSECDNVRGWIEMGRQLERGELD